MSKKRKHNKAKRKVKPAKVKNNNHDSLVSTAASLFEQGDLAGSKKVLRKVLKHQSSHIEALYHMGLIHKSEGNIDDALSCLNKIVDLDPNYANAYFIIGSIYIDQEKHNDALEMFKKVVSIIPDYTNAWFNLGFISTTLGKNENAISFYKKAIDSDPGYAYAYLNIGSIYLNDNKPEEAITFFEKAIEADPNNSDAWFNLGHIEMSQKSYIKAIDFFNKAKQIKPDYVEAIVNIGLIKQIQELYDDALQYYETAISINPEYSGSYINLGNVYSHKGKSAKALEYYEKAASLDPSPVAYNNVCGVQKELCDYNGANETSLKLLEFPNLGKTDLSCIHDTLIQICEWEKASETIERFRVADFDPASKDVLAGSLMEFCGNTDLSLNEISDLHKLWGDLTQNLVEPYPHDSDSTRFQNREKPRIAYISPDLRKHSVGYLIKDIITSHNHDELEIYCYANHDSKDSDAFTQEMIDCCKCFKYIKHLPDKTLADEIYNDEIDILIDLAGHTAGHRLRSMAYKPAPIQMTYLGYPNTTGMSLIDYRITDRYAETTEDKDYRYAENLLRLTNCFLTFKGFPGTTPEFSKEKKKDAIVFGCFNNIQKLTPTAIKLWAKILQQVENSVLHLKAKQLNTDFVWKNITDEFEKYGISEERLKCLGYAPTRDDHLKCYNNIDIALDTFPTYGSVAFMIFCIKCLHYN